MTPNEKAKELIEKFRPHSQSNWDERYGYDKEQETENAKQCAIICCDEILEVIGHPTVFHETRAYWQQVKQYLNKI